MDMSDYALGLMAQDRLARAREAATRRALAACAPPRESLRVRLGAALVGLGQRLLQEPAPHRAAP